MVLWVKNMVETRRRKVKVKVNVKGKERFWWESEGVGFCCGCFSFRKRENRVRDRGRVELGPQGLHRLGGKWELPTTGSLVLFSHVKKKQKRKFVFLGEKKIFKKPTAHANEC